MRTVRGPNGRTEHSSFIGIAFKDRKKGLYCWFEEKTWAWFTPSWEICERSGCDDYFRLAFSASATCYIKGPGSISNERIIENLGQYYTNKYIMKRKSCSLNTANTLYNKPFSFLDIRGLNLYSYTQYHWVSEAFQRKVFLLAITLERIFERNSMQYVIPGSCHSRNNLNFASKP